MKVLDTTFLIDLQKEAGAKKKGKAHQFLAKNKEEFLSISVISVVEFEEGFAESDLALARQYLGAFPIIYLDLIISQKAAVIRRFLRKTGQIIGDHDILIAATAIVLNATLVTDNTDHFSRIGGLNLESYR